MLMTKESYEECLCVNGSYTCGLSSALKNGFKCNNCKKDELDKGMSV